ncbi:MAG: aspartate aminotransferase family protein [Pararhodobacter sp.]|nr:aspartate aminotransferase family protein [Pararhodobacter sp.]
MPRIARAEGIYLWDGDGHRMIDGSSGAISVNIGHCNPEVTAAMQAQIEQLTYANPMQWENGANIELAERLAALVGWGFDAAFFVSGGSEANEAAIKLARQVALARGQDARRKVISRVPSYHGATTALLGVVGDPNYSDPFDPLFVSHPKVPAPITYRRPAGETPEAVTERCLTALEDTIAREGPETILAFLIEPVGGVSTGALVASDRYMTRIREICTQHGILLMFDEIMSGAGRTGRFLAAHHWPDCRPDIVTLAKGVSGSYAPLGAVMAAGELVMEVRAAGGLRHGHTYIGHPLSCAASNAVLKVVEGQGLIENAARMGERLRAGLETLASRHQAIGDVRGLGLLLAMEIVRERNTRSPWPAEAMASEYLVQCCRRNGASFYSRRTAGGSNGEWLMICPPLTCDADQIDELLGALDAGLSEFARTMPAAVA